MSGTRPPSRVWPDRSGCGHHVRFPPLHPGTPGAVVVDDDTPTVTLAPGATGAVDDGAALFAGITADTGFTWLAIWAVGDTGGHPLAALGVDSAFGAERWVDGTDCVSVRRFPAPTGATPRTPVALLWHRPAAHPGATAVARDRNRGPCRSSSPWAATSPSP